MRSEEEIIVVYKCSKCGITFSRVNGTPNDYCPNCNNIVSFHHYFVQDTLGNFLRSDILNENN